MRIPKMMFFVFILMAYAQDYAAAQKGRGYPEVRLKLTISNNCVDALGISTPCAIQNDGKGDYVDGSENVVAYLTKDGELMIETNTTVDAPPGSAIRSLTLNWMPSLNLPPGEIPDPMSYIPDYHIEAVKRTLNPIPIQFLGTTGFPTSACYKAHIRFRDLTKDMQWINNYRLGWDDNVGNPTSFWLITRTSGITWAVSAHGCTEGVGAGQDTSHLWTNTIKGKMVVEDKGYFFSPVAITLIAK